jgi:hypothetical protein
MLGVSTFASTQALSLSLIIVSKQHSSALLQVKRHTDSTGVRRKVYSIRNSLGPFQHLVWQGGIYAF